MKKEQFSGFIPKYIGQKNEQPRQSRKEEMRETLAEVIKIFILAAAVILPVRMFLIQPFYVKGASMEPNFYENEYLIIDKITPRLRAYQRGEPIVFRYPPSERKYLIKRIIGLPSERVVIHERRIMIYNAEHPDGFALDEGAYNPYLLRDEEIDVQLSGSEYYVLGDNRPLSFDSEMFGPIKKENITGRVFFRGWPVGRMTVFEPPTY